jgi:hypothetical protein
VIPVQSFVPCDGTAVSVEITLPSELVEHAVLTDSRLNVSLSPNGRLALYAEGVSDAAMEAASRTMRQQTLESLIQDCLNPDLLAGDDDAVRELSALRAQLVRALAQVDGALERLKHQ